MPAQLFKSLILLPIMLIHAGSASVRAESVISGLSAISESDVRESAIAFVNMSTSPGLEGATLRLDRDDRQSEQWRASLGFSAEFTIEDHIYNGYWGLAVSGGSLSDKLELIADNGQPVLLDLTRDVVALRGSLGLSFPINEYFKLRPFLSLILSDMQSRTIVDGLTITDPAGNTTTRSVYETGAQLISGIGSMEAIYSRWYGDNRLELGAQYNLIYTDAFSEDNPLLDTIDWNHTAQLKSKYSGATALTTKGRPWRWNGYANYTTFMSHETASLGYKNFFDVGAGLDWQMNIKPLDWFGWQSLGVRAGVILGRDIEGYNVGLTAQ